MEPLAGQKLVLGRITGNGTVKAVADTALPRYTRYKRHCGRGDTLLAIRADRTWSGIGESLNMQSPPCTNVPLSWHTMADSDRVA